jgi:hypothetical protein
MYTRTLSHRSLARISQSFSYSLHGSALVCFSATQPHTFHTSHTIYAIFGPCVSV